MNTENNAENAKKEQVEVSSEENEKKGDTENTDNNDTDSKGKEESKTSNEPKEAKEDAEAKEDNKDKEDIEDKEDKEHSFQITEAKISQDRLNKVYSCVAYIPFLWVLGLMFGKNDESIKHHMNQGMLFNIFYFLLLLVVRIIFYINVSISLTLIGISSFLIVLVNLWALIYIAKGFYNVFKEREKPLMFMFKNIDIIK